MKTIEDNTIDRNMTTIKGRQIDKTMKSTEHRRTIDRIVKNIQDMIMKTIKDKTKTGIHESNNKMIIKIVTK